MIQISNINKVRENDTARLFAEIIINNNKEELFYETRLEFYDSLCDTTAESFVLAVLPLALLNGYNIKSYKPISKKFYNGLTEILIPALLKMNKSFQEIEIICDITTADSTFSKGDATGISCGVDSFYTVISLSEVERSTLKYLTYFDSLNHEEDYNQKKESFFHKLTHPCEVTEKFNLKFTPVFSNVNCFMKDFAYEQIHTFSNLSHALALQHMIDKYFYSTAFPDSSYKLEFKYNGNYDNLTQKAIRTESFRMVSYGGEANRLDKTKFISNNDIVKSNLDVCLQENKTNKLNCSQCAKCIRTMVTLDVLGVIKYYHKVFDLNLYNKNKVHYFADILYRNIIMKCEFSDEILVKVREEKIRLPKLSYVYFFRIGIVNQFNKLKRRVI